MDSDFIKNRKGNIWIKKYVKCPCCRDQSCRKEPRNVLRAKAMNKQLNYAPVYSVCWYGVNNSGSAPEFQNNDPPEYIPGLSKWKKSLRQKERDSKYASELS